MSTNANDQQTGTGQQTTGNASTGQQSSSGNSRSSGTSSNNNSNNNNNNSGNNSSSRNRNQTGSNRFRGAVPDLHDFVFCLPKEQPNLKPYADVLDQLRLYIDKTYPKVCTYFRPLFNNDGNTREPEVPLPEPTVFDPGPAPDPTDAPATAVWTRRRDIFARMEDEAVKSQTQTFIQHQSLLKSARESIFNVILSQCSDAVQGTLKEEADFAIKEEAGACQWLLTTIKRITTNLQPREYPYKSLLGALRRLLNCHQHPRGSKPLSVEQYIERVRENFNDLTTVGGFTLDPSWDASLSTLPASKQQAAIVDKFLAILIVENSGGAGGKALRTKLRDAYVFDKVAGGPASPDRVTYPTTIEHARLLLNHEVAEARLTSSGLSPSGPNNDRQRRTAAGTSFAQSGGTSVPGRDGTLHAAIECYRCHQQGHYSTQCPSVVEGAQFAEWDTASTPSPLPAGCILLDSDSSHSIFRDPHLLSNIRPAPTPLSLAANGGSTFTDREGTLSMFPTPLTVYFNPYSLANILSLAHVMDSFRVTMDTSIAPCFLVHVSATHALRFLRHHSNLFLYDPSVSPCAVPVPPCIANASLESSLNSSSPVSPYDGLSFIQTVADNKRLFTRREVALADDARALCHNIGARTPAFFENLLANGYIKNTTLTVDDSQRAQHIYGKDTRYIKGHQTKPNPIQVPTTNILPLPPYILQFHRNVSLCIDFLFFNKIPFFHTISRKLSHRTIERFPTRQKRFIIAHLREAINKYRHRGFNVVDIHGDGEFACIRPEFEPDIATVTYPKDTKVGEIERSNRTVGEMVRSFLHGLPFKRVCILFLEHLVQHCVECLNDFPAPNGISDKISPNTIVLGKPPPEYNDYKLPFGSYCQIYIETTNRTNSRTMGAIAMNKTRTGRYFLSLATGECVHRTWWESLPITDNAIQRMNILGINDKQPLIKDLLIESMTGTIIDEDIYDHDYEPPENDEKDIPFVFDDYEQEDLQALMDDNEEQEGADEPSVHEDLAAVPEAFDDAFHHTAEVTSDDSTSSDDDTESAPSIDNPVDAGPNEHDASQQGATEHAPTDSDTEFMDIDEQHDTSQHLDARAEGNYVGRLRPRENVQPTRRLIDEMDDPPNSKSYTAGFQFFQRAVPHAPADLSPERFEEIEKSVFGFNFHQMSATAGIRKHGDTARAALLKEAVQLMDEDVFHPFDARNMTEQERILVLKEALRAVNLIKEKRNGILKGRTCADG